MVATPKIRCAVVAITADDKGMINATTAEFEPRFRPSDLLPWTDPYIAGLVRKLQAEVRSEREPVNPAAGADAIRADLELPWTGDEDDRASDESPAIDADRWTLTESVS